MKKKKLKKLLADRVSQCNEYESKIIRLRVEQSTTDYLKNVAEAKLASIKTHIAAGKDSKFPAERTLSVVESIL